MKNKQENKQGKLSTAEQPSKQNLVLPTKEKFERGLYECENYYLRELKDNKEFDKNEIARIREELKQKQIISRAKERNTKNKLVELHNKLKDLNQSYKNRIEELRKQFQDEYNILENKDSEVLK